MQTRTEQYDVGVIVGRFQVPELHFAHRDLIESVMAKHGKTIIVLGLSPLCSSRHATGQHHAIAEPQAPHAGAGPPCGCSVEAPQHGQPARHSHAGTVSSPM